MGGANNTHTPGDPKGISKFSNCVREPVKDEQELVEIPGSATLHAFLERAGAAEDGHLGSEKKAERLSQQKMQILPASRLKTMGMG